MCTMFGCGLHTLDVIADSRGMQHRTGTADYQGAETASTNLVKCRPQTIAFFLLFLAMSKLKLPLQLFA